MIDSLQVLEVPGKPIYFHHLITKLWDYYSMLLASMWIFKKLYVMRCAIWYYLYNFKNMKNSRRWVLLLEKLQALACNFTKSNTPPWLFFMFLKLYKWYQIAQHISYVPSMSSHCVYIRSTLTVIPTENIVPYQFYNTMTPYLYSALIINKSKIFLIFGCLQSSGVKTSKKVPQK